MEKKTIELVKKSDIFKLVIPEEVERKIRYICQQVWNTEWSGTLFYKPEGSFEDGTLTIRCIDVYVMDIGTAAYTEFNMSPEVISYMTENPELLDCQLGLIHSHSTFSTFFSGTDTSTLKEEGIDRNHFVSLIVNNEGTYTAAITRRVKSTKTIEDNFTYSTFDGKTISDTKTYSSEDEELEWFYLNIEFEKKDSFQEELKGRLNEIRKAKKDKVSAQRQNNLHNDWGNNLYQNSYLQKYNESIKDKPQPFKTSVNVVNDVKNPDNGKLPLDWECKESEGFADIDYGVVKFNKQTIKSLVLQLITGSIILPNESRIDVKKWAQGMSPLYRKRFGVGDEGMKSFRTWADGYVEYLCWFTGDDNLIEAGLCDEEMAAVCAYDMIEELKKLPSNEYIKVYIEILEGYLI